MEDKATAPALSAILAAFGMLALTPALWCACDDSIAAATGIAWIGNFDYWTVFFLCWFLKHARSGGGK